MKLIGDADEFDLVRPTPMSSKAEAKEEVPTLYAEERLLRGGEEVCEPPLLTALVVLGEERVPLAAPRMLS
jgi:hypothetical protein